MMRGNSGKITEKELGPWSAPRSSYLPPANSPAVLRQDPAHSPGFHCLSPGVPSPGHGPVHGVSLGGRREHVKATTRPSGSPPSLPAHPAIPALSFFLLLSKSPAEGSMSPSKSLVGRAVRLGPRRLGRPWGGEHYKIIPPVSAP
jgi:hypothetical protein